MRYVRSPVDRRMQNPQMQGGSFVPTHASRLHQRVIYAEVISGVATKAVSPVVCLSIAGFRDIGELSKAAYHICLWTPVHLHALDTVLAAIALSNLDQAFCFSI
jgi:hypothetical protein